MSDYKSAFLRTLDERGYIKQATHQAELDTYCETGVPICYYGCDATAESLHVGSLVGIMTLRHFQQAGGKPIVLIGGGTTKIGDPTDKESSRPILTEAEIERNAAGIRKAFEPFLTFGDGPTDAIMVNNDDWLSSIGYIQFLREIGKLFTINTMVKQDTVARRLRNEEPYTFLEFNYTLLQAYDFLELFRKLGCQMQVGGSDQWGNIVAGVDLIHKADGGQGFGLTWPLIATASGAKMGKTAEGAVWLNADKRSPYDYWQFWRNTEDADVGRFMKLFTEFTLDEIAAFEALDGAEINQAKIALANAATTMLHGEQAAKDAEAAASKAFAGGGVSSDLPTFELPKAEFADGPTTTALLRAGQLVASNGEARRKMNEGAVRVNDDKISADQTHAWSDILSEVEAFKVQVGKKRIALVKPV
ncbi:MAG: tyrosine--tRNA ligase [Pseudomonadota bacterium]